MLCLFQSDQMRQMEIRWHAWDSWWYGCRPCLCLCLCWILVADESQGHVFCCSGHFWWHRSFLQPNILVIFTIRSYLQTVVHRLPLEVRTFTNLTARCACAVSLAGVIFALFCTDAVPKMSCLLQMYFSWPCNISYPWLIEEILEEMYH